jgi:hypothetical protein
MEHRKNSGIYNLGTGKARSFNDLGKSTFTALNKPVQINYIDINVIETMVIWHKVHKIKR